MSVYKCVCVLFSSLPRPQTKSSAGKQQSQKGRKQRKQESSEEEEDDDDDDDDDDEEEDTPKRQTRRRAATKVRYGLFLSTSVCRLHVWEMPSKNTFLYIWPLINIFENNKDVYTHVKPSASYF